MFFQQMGLGSSRAFSGVPLNVVRNLTGASLVFGFCTPVFQGGVDPGAVGPASGSLQQKAPLSARPGRCCPKCCSWDELFRGQIKQTTKRFMQSTVSAE